MNVSRQIEPESTKCLLARLSLAIDEAKLVREIVQVKNQAVNEGSRDSYSRRLLFLDREIELLEDKLEKVRSQANVSEV